MEKKSKIFVTGHKGLVGSAIFRKLREFGYENIITRTRSELDLLDSVKVKEFFQIEKPEYVFMGAAKVGGILANNTYPADFIYDNLQVQNNIIHNAYIFRVKKLLFLGSSCIYPRLCPQPMKEEYLLSGPLEPTNEPYAVAKIAGIKMCQSYRKQYGADFISVMPTNQFGINDNFNYENSHVFPALLRRAHEAKMANAPQMVIWGTGNPRREFMYVDDMADACIFLMNNYSDLEFVNIGTGIDMKIKDLVEIILEIVGYKGDLKFDTTKPDGMPKKLLDVSKLINLGWSNYTDFKTAVEITYAWFLETIERGHLRE